LISFQKETRKNQEKPNGEEGVALKIDQNLTEKTKRTKTKQTKPKHKTKHTKQNKTDNRRSITS